MINTNAEDLDEEALLYTATIVNGNDAKAAVYKKAADKFNSSRAWNNLGATYINAGKLDEAKKALNHVSDKNDAYYNNMTEPLIWDFQKVQWHIHMLYGIIFRKITRQLPTIL